MKTIENNMLAVKINEIGAELSSVVSKRTGREYIWQGDPNIWTGHAPVLFPICGTLCNGSYYHKGEKYQLPKHGFARRMSFSLSKSTDTSAEFTLCADEDTKKVYPFDFELHVSFKLCENKLETKYRIVNKNGETIYFSIGAHPAFNVSLGGKLVFEKNEDMSVLIADKNGLIDGKRKDSGRGGSVLLTEHTFDDDALIFDAPKSTYATVVNENGSPLVKMTFGKVPYILLWAKPNAPYVCIEPWHGIPDSAGNITDISKKPAIISLKDGYYDFVTKTEFFD